MVKLIWYEDLWMGFKAFMHRWSLDVHAESLTELLFLLLMVMCTSTKFYQSKRMINLPIVCTPWSNLNCRQGYNIMLMFAEYAEPASVQRRPSRPATRIPSQGGSATGRVRARWSSAQAGHHRPWRRTDEPCHHRSLQARPLGTRLLLPRLLPRGRLRRLLGRHASLHRHRVWCLPRRR